MSQYELPNLIKTFLKHAEEVEERHSKQGEQFIKENPNEPVPDWVREEFNLSYALAYMCFEINKLKK